MKPYGVIVIGGGHAGCEAALASARMGVFTALITLDFEKIALMPCNPAIGGIGKGHIVREIDALGGQMARCIDETGIQFRILNSSKGPAVQGYRAQADKHLYKKEMRRTLEMQDNLSLICDEVDEVLLNADSVRGLRTSKGLELESRSIIITTGTFLNGRIHLGMKSSPAGRAGEKPSTRLSQSFLDLGFELGRLKTGTPPRLLRKSIDFSKCEIQKGDSNPRPFSFSTEKINRSQVPCHITYTNDRTAGVIRSNMHLSPLYSGHIDGIGPRYCPSIEDKIHRFSHHDSHTLFLEPEWLNSDQIYTNGFSTSLPEAVQLRALRTVPALKKAVFFRPGYAIEYDFFHPAQLKSTLETKEVAGLFFAGQINGTSGYEEAGAQGLLAGINATSLIKERSPIVLSRDQSYIGVMIDDLITKDTLEPYRMFTSRAEYRLMLRYSNTEERLYDTSLSAGVLEPGKKKNIEQRIRIKEKIRNAIIHSLSPDDIKNHHFTLKQKQPAASVLKRPGFSIYDLPKRFFKNIDNKNELPEWSKNELFFDVEAEIKYEGYIKRHLKEVAKLKKNEFKKISPKIDYFSMVGLSSEAKEKLSFVRPENIGQAMRISGITAADISVMMVNLLR